MLFHTGSHRRSTAQYLAAAITSSNGHNGKINITNEYGPARLILTQSKAGTDGNTFIVPSHPLTSSIKSITGSILPL